MTTQPPYRPATFIAWQNAVRWAHDLAHIAGRRFRVERDPTPGIKLWRVVPTGPRRVRLTRESHNLIATLPPGYRPGEPYERTALREAVTKLSTLGVQAPRHWPAR